MKKNWRLGLKVLLVLILVGSSAYIGIRQMEYRKGAEVYDDAEQIASLPLPEEDAASDREQDPYIKMYASIDLKALQEVNEDVIGWISIPYTEVSYPLLQAEDNQYYLKRTWRKESNSVGSVYLECQNAPDLSEFNTIIYGHNMRNGTMFGSLKHYQDPEYWKAHPSVYIVTEDGVFRYDIFAAYNAKTKTNTFALGIQQDRTKQAFIQDSIANSKLDTGIVPTEEDQVVTLSTCTPIGYTRRWVVQGVLNTEVSTGVQQS